MYAINLYGTIGDNLTMATVEEAVNAAPDGDIMLNIDSPGGSVLDALAIYDMLRTSGRVFHTHIAGGCSSAATLLLVAAPKGNRTSIPNPSCLVHRATADVWGNADEVGKTAEFIQECEDLMVTIESERTNLTPDELREIMAEEKFRTAAELIEWGFIDSVIPYISNNSKNKKMTKKTTTMMDRIRRMVKNAELFTFSNAAGEVVLQSEDETIVVGSICNANGTFQLINGDGAEVEVVVEEFVATTVTPVAAAGDEATPEDVAELAAMIAALQNENATLRAQMAAKDTEITNLKSLASDYKPAGRRVDPKETKKQSYGMTPEARKAVADKMRR